MPFRMLSFRAVTASDPYVQIDAPLWACGLSLNTAPELFAHEYDVADSKEPSTCAFIDVVVYRKRSYVRFYP